MRGTHVDNSSITFLQTQEVEVVFDHNFTINETVPPAPINTPPIYSKNIKTITMAQISEPLLFSFDKSGIEDAQNDPIETRWQIAFLDKDFIEPVDNSTILISPTLATKVGWHTAVLILMET